MGSVGPLPTVYYPTVPRPWVPSPDDAEFRRDPVTGTPCIWNVTEGRWVPVGPNDIPFTLTVDGINGDDTWPGDAASPLKTIQEAFRRLPPRIRHDAVVDVLDNAGTDLLYDEQARLEDIATENLASLRIVGKSALESSIAAAPGNSGTYRTWTISPSPGWAPQTHVGKYILFTAGTHAGSVAWILGNTADTLTLGYRPLPVVEGPYDNTDAGEIRVITTRLKQQSVPFLPNSLIVNNSASERLSGGTPISFEHMHIEGDASLNFAIQTSGVNSLQFSVCRIDDYVSTGPSSGGKYDFSDTLAWTCRNAATAWFSSTPGNDLALGFRRGGIIGGFALNLYNGGNYQIFGVNVSTNPVTPANTPRNMFDFGGKTASFSFSSIDGGGISTPVYCGPGGHGILRIQMVEIYGSVDSGIKFSPSTLSAVHLVVDENALPGFPLSDIHDNWEYGIDFCGGRLSFFNPTEGTNNGVGGVTTGGVRIRDGGLAGFFGIAGDEPLIQDALGNQIDFDNRSPALIIGYGVETVGLQTLCSYRYRGI